MRIKKVFKHRAKLIREKRVEHKLSQKELGDILDISSQLVSQIEREVQSVSIELWIKMAKALSIPLPILRKCFMDDYQETIDLYFEGQV